MSLPVILTGRETSVVVDEAIEALAAQGVVLERGHQLVEVLIDRRTPAVGERPSPARAAAITAHRLAELAESAAAWMKRVQDDDGEWVERPTRPPTHVVQTIIDRQLWPLPSLRGVTESPFVRLDGTLVAETGFDAVTGYYMARPSDLVVDVHPEAGIDDAQAAYQRLLDVLVDFPFETDAHGACAVAALLTLVARPSISGPVPMFLVTSSTPGSGKTLLVRVLHEIATGRDLHCTAFPEREDELEKRITSILMASQVAALFDNIDGSFGSPSLDALITATSWMGRELGRSHMITVPARTVLFGTGNNTRIRGDLARRVVPVRLEPGVERPEDREAFHIPRILAHVRQRRSELFSHAITILRAYCVAGMPGRPPGFGSFEDWNHLVRGALLWCGAADPLDAVKAWVDDADEKREEFLALAAAWYEAFGSSPVLLSELPLKIEQPGNQALREALKVIAGKGEQVDMRLFGNRLRRERRRLFGRYQWDYADADGKKVHGARRWRLNVKKAGESGA